MTTTVTLPASAWAAQIKELKARRRRPKRRRRTPPKTNSRVPAAHAPPEPTADTDALIRGLVGNLEARSSAEADKMREAMRRAIRILTDAGGD